MSSPLDVSVSRFMASPPSRVRLVMFEPRNDPRWMAAVKFVELQARAVQPGARVRRTGRFLGRALRWTTEVVSIAEDRLELNIVDGPMRGAVSYLIEPSGNGSNVTIRNIGRAPGYAPRWLLALAMRRSLNADLRRLQRIVETMA
jgi:Polyketide cyclase / dehydrase and lipid transport